MGRLFWKFFFFFFLAQLTTVVGVGITIWLNTRSHALSGIEVSPPSRSVVEAASVTLEFGGVDGLHKLLQGWQTRPMPQVYAVDENGRELLQRPVSAATLLVAQEMMKSLSGEHYTKRIKANDGHEYLFFVPKLGRPGPIVFGEGSGNPENRTGFANEPPHPPPDGDMKGEHAPSLQPPHLFPFKPLLTGAFVSFIFAALLAWYVSKPIKSLRVAFEGAANGRLDTRIGSTMGSRCDELADLGHDFDSMACMLGNLMRGQTRLLHHVSHELRSPLARMQVAVGLARQNPEKIPLALERMERESERMDKLVGELLELSQLESGVININKDEVNFNELLVSVVEDAQFEAEALFENQALHPEVWLVQNAHFLLLGQADLLHRAIENVVRNALKFSPSEGDVRIELGYGEASSNAKIKLMRLVVSDQGPGVPEAELESIFQPFVRGSTAKSGDGHGVGLAIAKQVIEAHGGTVVAKNRAAQNPAVTGLSVEIELPYLSASMDDCYMIKAIA